MKFFKQFLVVVFLAVSMAACSTNPLVHTAQDGTEVRFDTPAGAVQQGFALVESVANTVAKAVDDGSMSMNTAKNMHSKLQEAREGLSEARQLLALGRAAEAETKAEAARIILDAMRTAIIKSGISLEGTQL